jgi:hypothetical protein
MDGVRRLVGVALLGVSLSAWAAPPVGYAQATGYYKRDTRPTQYQPLNLLDGREVTAWCARGGDALADVLSFGFHGTAKIDEIRVYTGNGFDEASFQRFGRARKLMLKTSTGASTFTVADRRGLQAVTLNPPLKGSNFTLEILDEYPPEDPEMPVCLTDVVFYSDGRPLNGAWMTPKLKYDRHRAPLLGTWYAGYEGAADQTLSFFFDESYRYVFEPLDPELKGKVLQGTYDVSGSRIELEIPGKGKVLATIRRDRQEDEKGNVRHTLTLEGAGLPASLTTTFRDSP